MCAQTCLHVSNDVYTIGLVSPIDVATPPIVLDVVQDDTNVIPVHPRSNGALHPSLHTTQLLRGQQYNSI